MTGRLEMTGRRWGRRGGKGRGRGSGQGWGRRRRGQGWRLFGGGRQTGRQKEQEEKGEGICSHQDGCLRLVQIISNFQG